MDKSLLSPFSKGHLAPGTFKGYIYSCLCGSFNHRSEIKANIVDISPGKKSISSSQDKWRWQCEIVWQINPRVTKKQSYKHAWYHPETADLIHLAAEFPNFGVLWLVPIPCFAFAYSKVPLAMPVHHHTRLPDCSYYTTKKYPPPSGWFSHNLSLQ